MNLAYIPSPTFSKFEIGPFTIHMYAICILIGICVAVWILATRWKRYGGTFDQILDTTLVTVPCALVGARLYHCITTPADYFPPTGNLVNILKVWEGGMAIFGGISVGTLVAFLWCRHKHYPFAIFADAIAPALPVAQAIGRLGNWFNQELYGWPTTLPWGLKLNDADAIGKSEICYSGAQCPDYRTTLFHPTFLYEMIWNLIGAALIIYLGHKLADRLKAGQQFAMYLMWYGLGRTWIENVRINYSTVILPEDQRVDRDHRLRARLHPVRRALPVRAGPQGAGARACGGHRRRARTPEHRRGTTSPEKASQSH